MDGSSSTWVDDYVVARYTFLPHLIDLNHVIVGFYNLHSLSTASG